MTYHRILFNIFLGLVFNLFLSTFIFAQGKSERVQVCGTVVDAADHATLPFSVIRIEELGLSMMTDADGYFCTPHLHKGKYTLTARYMGYETRSTTVSVAAGHPSKVTIRLYRSSHELPEVTIYGRVAKGTSNIVIDQKAIEYLQPLSLQNVMTLLPGELTVANVNMQRVSLKQNRQVGGGDKATSLGTVIVSDGITLSNDASRFQVAHIKDEYVNGKYAFLPANVGVDLRNFSTDHIETVKIIRGIASAKYGNLSSGVIEVTSKRGRSPITARGLINLSTKMIYVGKGFSLGKKGGTLYAGMDFTRYQADPVYTFFSAYDRVTSMLTYSNKFKLLGADMDLFAKYDYTHSLNGNKEERIGHNDESVIEQYKSTYDRHALMGRTGIVFGSNPFITKLTLALSLERIEDSFWHYKRAIAMRTGMIQPHYAPGPHPAVILKDRIYMSEYINENLPHRLFFRLDGETSDISLLGGTHNLSYGLDYEYNKNKGRGLVLKDPYRPPFPDSQNTIRPFPNNLIPYLSSLGCYIEDRISYTLTPKAEVTLTAGIRGTKPLNIPRSYLLDKLFLVDPRVNLSFSLSSEHSHRGFIQDVFWVSYGRQSKLPTLDYLYPAPIYREYPIGKGSPPMYHTIIVNNRNPELRPDRNNKFEAGWNHSENAFTLTLSLFTERMLDAVQVFEHYAPISYDIGKVATPQSPETTKTVRAFTSKSIPVNAAGFQKYGIEYQLRFPNVSWLKSDIEINGAYYRTHYGYGAPVWLRPKMMIGGSMIPYVGLYDKGVQWQIYDRLNTNIYIHTRIPKHGFLMTNMLQIVWLQNQWYDNTFSHIPSQYMDINGDIHPYSEEIVKQKAETEPLLKMLMAEKVWTKYVLTTKEPLAFMFNTKVSKELFDQHLTISFYANAMVSLTQRFLDEHKFWHRRTEAPVFGAEVRVKF